VAGRRSERGAAGRRRLAKLYKENLSAPEILYKKIIVPAFSTALS
jgi:hypothetical protein